MIGIDLSLNVSLRPAVFAEDREFLYQLFLEAHPEFQRISAPQEEIDALTSMQFRMQQQGYESQFRGSRHDVILLDGLAVGRIWVDRTEDQILVVDIAVLSNYRSRGIGGWLYREILSEAEAKGVPVRCTVERYNTGSYRFHQRLGFSVYDETEVLQLMEWVPANAIELAMTRPSYRRFEQFRELVLQDETLEEQLREQHDLDACAELAIRLGRERGFEFDRQDVARANRESMKRWVERWVDA